MPSGKRKSSGRGRTDYIANGDMHKSSHVKRLNKALQKHGFDGVKLLEYIAAGKVKNTRRSGGYITNGIHVSFEKEKTYRLNLSNDSNNDSTTPLKMGHIILTRKWKLTNRSKTSFGRSVPTASKKGNRSSRSKSGLKSKKGSRSKTSSKSKKSRSRSSSSKSLKGGNLQNKKDKKRFIAALDKRGFDGKRFTKHLLSGGFKRGGSPIVIYQAFVNEKKSAGKYTVNAYGSTKKKPNQNFIKRIPLSNKWKKSKSNSKTKSNSRKRY